MLFGRPQQIIKSLIEKTRSLPSRKEHRPESIIAFANSLAHLVATMKSLKFLGHLNNPSLLEEYVSKLPATLQLQWCLANHGENEPGLERLSSWMMVITKAACSMPAQSDKKDDLRSEKALRRPVLLTSLSASKTNLKRSCPRCSSDRHSLEQCDDFIEDSLKGRWNFVSRSKLCFSCLGSGHQINNCPEKQQCGKRDCDKRHHHLLHEDEEN